MNLMHTDLPPETYATRRQALDMPVTSIALAVIWKSYARLSEACLLCSWAVLVEHGLRKKKKNNKTKSRACPSSMRGMLISRDYQQGGFSDTLSCKRSSDSSTCPVHEIVGCRKNYCKTLLGSAANAAYCKACALPTLLHPES